LSRSSAIYKKYAYWSSPNGRGYFSCFCYDGVQVQTREHVILAKEVGIKYIVVFINKLDSIVEPVMQDLVELEVRELLESYGYPSDLPVIKGSARLALNEQEPSTIGLLAVNKLMDTVDSYIKQPERLVNVPFLLAIEQTYVITGRGTVVTGKVEQGMVKITDNLEVVGIVKKEKFYQLLV
jgi:elongation factor Tu